MAGWREPSLMVVQGKTCTSARACLDGETVSVRRCGCVVTFRKALFCFLEVGACVHMGAACGCPHLPAFHRTASSCEQQFETHSSERPRLHVHLCCLVSARVYHLHSSVAPLRFCSQCPLMAYDGFLMHNNYDPEFFYDDGSDVEGFDAMTFAMMCTSSSLCNSCLWLRRCQDHAVNLWQCNRLRR